MKRRGRMALCAALIALAGCTPAEKKVVVKGKLLDNGKPLHIATEGLPPGERGIRLSFYPVQENGTLGDPEEATVAPQTATFELRGHDGKGIKPGKYRVGYTIGSLFGRPGEKTRQLQPEQSKIIRDIGGDAELTIDLAKSEG